LKVIFQIGGTGLFLGSLRSLDVLDNLASVEQWHSKFTRW